MIISSQPERSLSLRKLPRHLLMLVFLHTPAVYADAGWTDAARILSLETNIFGRTLVELELRKNPSGCKQGALFYRETTGDSSQAMLKVLLEAASNRLPVKLRVTGICHLKGYAEFSAVTLVP